MKTFGKLAVVAVAVSLAACQAEKETAEQTPVQLETELQKQAYSLGAQLGQFIETNTKENARIGIELDKQLILTGISDALEGKAQLSEDEVVSFMTSLETQLREKREEMARVEAEAAVKVGQDFLVENAKRDGVSTTESGLQYEVLTEGTGAKPVATDTVKVHYRGTLITGEEFDSSYSRNEPATFPLNRVIKGWTEGVQLMNEGAKFKFVIPSDLAYGPRAAGSIPPNSTLVFEVELLEIVKEEAAAEGVE